MDNYTDCMGSSMCLPVPNSSLKHTHILSDKKMHMISVLARRGGEEKDAT